MATLDEVYQALLDRGMDADQVDAIINENADWITSPDLDAADVADRLVTEYAGQDATAPVGERYQGNRGEGEGPPASAPSAAGGPATLLTDAASVLQGGITPEEQARLEAQQYGLNYDTGRPISPESEPDALTEATPFDAQLEDLFGGDANLVLTQLGTRLAAAGLTSAMLPGLEGGQQGAPNKAVIAQLLFDPSYRAVFGDDVQEILAPYVAQTRQEQVVLGYVNADGRPSQTIVALDDYQQVLTIPGINMAAADEVFRSLARTGMKDRGFEATALAVLASSDDAYERILLRLNDPTSGPARRLIPRTDSAGNVRYFYQDTTTGEFDASQSYTGFERAEDERFQRLNPNAPATVASGVRGALSSLLDGKASQFKALMNRFGGAGSAELAFIGMHDLRLAQRIFERGDVDLADASQVAEILSDYGADDLRQAGFGSNPMVWAALTDPGSFSGSGGADRLQEISLPDDKALRENYRELYTQLLLRDPTEAELDSFVNTVYNDIRGKASAAIAADQQAQPRINVFQGIFDIPESTPGGVRTVEVEGTSPSEIGLDLLRQSGEYQALYGNRPQGMSEVEYAGQFASAAQATLGLNAGDAMSARRSGMMTGDVRTTIGRAAMSEAGLRSSTLQERLARAAQAVANFT